MLNTTFSGFYKNSFIDLFYKQVNTNPSSIAVVAEDSKITYDELNKRSNKLARFLKKNGVKNESLVGLCTSLNTNFIVCLLGILKAGGAYFPLDPTYPNERLQFMLKDGNPATILTESKFSYLFDGFEERIIEIDKKSNCVFSSIEESDVKELIQPQDLAYVIYTSGSTGTPKGIMVTYGSLSNIALAHKKHYPDSLKMLISGGVCFDASLLVILHALINNGSLYLFNYSPSDKIETLVDFILLNSINYMICVPSHYAKILDKSRKFLFLKCVSLTGEVLPKNLCELHAESAPNALMYNEYGPSECAIGTTIAKIYDPSTQIIQNVTVGKPLDNTQIYILDHNLCRVPDGVKGEICISGVGLARGYLNKEELTKERFVQVALLGKKSIRLYRTGDLGRILPNGDLEFLGRVDQRIHIDGSWIDLGEIEYHISRCPEIKEFAVLVQTNYRGENELVVYITSKKATVKDFLINDLKNLFPERMIPTSIITIDKFPLSPNGKIDREKLVNLYA